MYRFWYVRIVGAVALILLTVLVACRREKPITSPPTTGDSFDFVITSPAEGAQVAGATFFSIQALEADKVESVTFKANGAELANDAPGEDTFKRFLIASDYLDGELPLSVTINGKYTQERTITINNNPPSSATVGSDGVVLGTREANGAVSTLSIPAGTNQGTSISFEAKTKEEVKASTGVDYDALGVTFLGAQEIDSSEPINQALMVGSGGFGPMVQPGQAVVNYMIAPDADGDGIGELVVVNTATVAPNGDVISDDLPAGFAASDLTVRTSQGNDVYSLDSTSFQVKPGSMLEFEITEPDYLSIFSNYLAYTIEGRDDVVIAPAMVTPVDGSDLKRGLVRSIVPILPDGKVNTYFLNISSKKFLRIASFSISTPVFDGNVAESLERLIDWHERQVMSSQVIDSEFKQSASSDFQSAKMILGELLGSDLSTSDFEAFEQLASFIDEIPLALFDDEIGLLQQGDFCASSSEGRAFNLAYAGAKTAISAAATYALVAGLGVVSLAEGSIIAIEGIALGSTMISTVVSGLAALGDPTENSQVNFGLGFLDLSASVSSLTSKAAGVLSKGFTLLGLTTNAQELGAALGCVWGQSDVGYTLRPPPRPPARLTGMGSAPPPGGSAGGMILSGSPTSSSENLQTLQNSSSNHENRFLIKITSNGQTAPFAGLSDESGYFYIPFIPEGQVFSALAIDSVTGDSRTFEGVGPATGDSTFISFNFLSGENVLESIQLESNLKVSLQASETRVYTFQGEAGQTIRLGLLAETGSADITARIEPLTGGVITEAVFPGFTARPFPQPVTLTETGVYTLTVSNASSVATTFDIGLAEVESTALTFTAGVAVVEPRLEVIGDIQEYTFELTEGEGFVFECDTVEGSNLDFYVRAEPNGGQCFPDLGQQDLVFNLPGTYRLVLDAVPDPWMTAGEYVILGEMRLSVLKPEQVVLPRNQVFTDGISSEMFSNDFKYYAIEGGETDRVNTVVFSEEIDSPLYADLYRSGDEVFQGSIGVGQSQIYNSFSFSPDTQLGFPSNAPYYLYFYANTEDDFDHTYSVLVSDVIVSGLQLADGSETVTDEIDLVGRTRLYRFNALAGESFTLTLSHPADSSFTTSLVVYSEAGDVQVDEGNVYTDDFIRERETTFVIPEDGSYVIDARFSTLGSGNSIFNAPLEARTGDYAFTLSKNP